MYYLLKKYLIQILIAVSSINCISCASQKIGKSYKIENYNMMQVEKFNITNYESNKTSGNIYEFTKEDGTKIKQMQFPGGYAEIETPPKPKIEKIEKIYYQNGSIQKIGASLNNLSIGIWRYYDEEGNETIINEDQKYGNQNYNDVLRFLENKGAINLNTGVGIEKIAIGYDPDKKIWRALVNDFKGKNHEYLFNEKIKVISHQTYTLAE